MKHRLLHTPYPIEYIDDLMEEYYGVFYFGFDPNISVWKKRWIALKYVLRRPYPMEYPDVIEEYFGATWFDHDGNITKERITRLGKLVKILSARKRKYTHEFVKEEYFGREDNDEDFEAI